METITNIFNGLFSGIDNIISGTIDNKYFFITIVVLTMLMGSLNHSRLVHNFMMAFDNPLSRIFMIGFIYYISTKNVPLAILMLTAILISMNTQNKQRLNYILVSMIRGKFLKRHRRRSPKNKRDNVLLIIRRKKLRSLISKLAKMLKEAKDKNLKRVPSNITVLAIKSKKLSNLIKENTPKLVKKVAEIIKKEAKLDGKNTPKVVKEISSTVGKIANDSVKKETSIKLISSDVINRLLKEEKINKKDAEKLLNLDNNSIIDILKIKELKNLEKNDGKINSKLAKELVKRIDVKTEISTIQPQPVTPSTKVIPVTNSSSIKLLNPSKNTEKYSPIFF
jgi:hypothetical protein